jgi:hypothetical protein
MLLKWNRIGLALAVVLVTPAVRVRTHTVEKETAAVVELGAAGNCNVKDGSGSFDPDVAVEVTPIRNWLELEAGVTPLFARHSTEWDTDLLFKRPWDFSPKVEFMAGFGPEWVHTHANGISSNGIAGEAVLDFMFWPRRKHRFGWYLEPGYDYGFGAGHEQSAGMSGGLPSIADPPHRSSERFV